MDNHRLRRQDGTRLVGDRRFDQIRVNAKGLWINVYKYRLTTLPQNGVGGGNIAIRRGDNLALEAQHLDGDL